MFHTLSKNSKPIGSRTIEKQPFARGLVEVVGGKQHSGRNISTIRSTTAVVTHSCINRSFSNFDTLLDKLGPNAVPTFS